MNISEERALAVSDALVDRGIDKERLDVAGYGSQRPFIPAISRQAFALNRRVDFGASLTPPPKATTVAKLSATLENSTVKLLAPPAIAAEQCPGEFSRLFLSDVVRFAGSSDDVTDEHAEFLDHLAGLLMSCPSFALDINGHTDRRGNAAFNQNLSERRAAAVRDALSDRGIADGRLAKFGYAG